MLKVDILGMLTIPCACGKQVIFAKKGKDYGIKVNCESLGEVHIPKMFHLFRSCKNPLCEWSKVEDFLNEA